VQKVAAAALKLQLLKETAKLGGVTQEEVESLFEVRPATTYRREAPPRRSFSPPSSTEWKLLASVAANPQIAPDVDLSLLDMELPESQALEELVGWCRGSVSIPMLIEQSQGSRHAELLAHARAWGENLRESEEQARVGLQHALWSLEIKRKDREIKSLGDRLQKGQLSKEEHLQYARMISEMQALKRRLQDESRSSR
jgi:hypothetical protein